MAYEEVTAVLGGWEGFAIQDVRRTPGSKSVSPVVEIELRRIEDYVSRCSGCGENVQELHDIAVRRIRELPILDADTWLIVPTARLRCPRCGPSAEALSWTDKYARMTRRFAESVARLAQVLPVQQVASYYRLSWDTVKTIDKRALQAEFGSVDLSSVREIAIDEFAIQKGHRYATVVIEPKPRRVLWVGRGRAREDLRPFFILLGQRGCRAIEAAVMDMSEAYESETRMHCPSAAIVYDLFHVVAKFSREVIDRVRVDETNRIADANRRRAVRSKRSVIKGTRWLLFRNRKNLSATDRIKLDEVLRMNRRLWVVYVLKDSLKGLWRYRYRGAALRAWRQWYSWAVHSRIPALVKFAKALKLRLPGIIAHCRYPLHTGVLEGINNKIKVIKRMAYGFRDDTYFFLKIRAAFPGNP